MATPATGGGPQRLELSQLPFPQLESLKAQLNEVTNGFVYFRLVHVQFNNVL